jgi:acetyltransferase-like isoleucine patch superfamily enzyme
VVAPSLRRVAREIPRAVGYYRGPRLMSWLRKRWVLLRHPHADIRFEGPVYLGPGFSLHIPRAGTFVVGPGVEFRRNFRAELEGGTIRIGAGAIFTYSVLMHCSTSIEIGERCMLGQSTLVVDGNHRYRDPYRPILDQGYDFTPIRIADGAAIAGKATIMADVGERAFVGANSVVTRPVPAYTLAVGAPAKPIEYYGPPDREPSAAPS